MRTVSRNTRHLTRATSALCFMLLLLSSLVSARSLVATTRAPGSTNQAGRQQPAAIANGTHQDFDLPNTGTPYTPGTHVQPPVSPPVVMDGGPTGEGKINRLAFGTPPVNHNSITFDRADAGPFDQVVADFDFRITPGSGRADGLGFALLNTAHYGTAGAVDPQAPLYSAEEPDFMGSLGIGLDIYQSSAGHLEINANHVSVHFNGALVQEFDATSALDLAEGKWNHARIIMRPGGGYSDVTVLLNECGKPPFAVIDQVRVPGFTPYEGRVRIGARSGGLAADHDIDNVHVQSLSLAQSVLSFTTGCHSVAEAAGEVTLPIIRAGDMNGSATVHYQAMPRSAAEDLDYRVISGTLTFQPGESAKVVRVPLLGDSEEEPPERFLVTLSDPTGDAALGGPAVANVTIVDDNTVQQKGQWSDIIPAQVVPIHMHMLPNGQVMYWDRHMDNTGWDGDPRLWDPLTQMISATQVPALAYDMFCAGHTFLENGDLLVTGGHITDLVGEDQASIYHPSTNTWTTLPAMNKGRWYPSNVTLPNGDALVMGGTYSTTQLNVLPQVLEVQTNTWRDLSTAPIAPSETGTYPTYPDFYPFLYVAPNGKIFNAGPQRLARYLDPSGTGSWTDVAPSDLAYRDYGSSVMYDEGKVMIVGGNPRDPNDANPTIVPNKSAEVIDLNDANPAWRFVEPMHFPRRHLNATLLPDGTVLATGGTSQPGFDNAAGAVLEAEQWDPTTEKWTMLAAGKRYRGYHSSALLLPDARVLVGGGGHPGASTQDNFEIFSPPYLFKGARPVITSAPKNIGYDQPFFVATPDAANIAKARLIRLSSVTHAFNQNQRINTLEFVQTTGGLTITTPLSPTLAPPGDYMLFLLNNQGVPSIAHMIQLDLVDANDDSYSNYTTYMSQTLVITMPTLLANDRIMINSTLTLTPTDPPHGSVIVDNTGSFTYTPDPNFTGTDSFTYTVDAGHGRVDTATVHITIDYTVDLPIILYKIGIPLGSSSPNIPPQTSPPYRPRERGAR